MTQIGTHTQPRKCRVVDIPSYSHFQGLESGKNKTKDNIHEIIIKIFLRNREFCFKIIVHTICKNP